MIIDPARVTRLLSPEVSLRRGGGSGINGKFDACVMQAVDWLAGGDGTSNAPECADRAISSFCVRLNDSPIFGKWRDELKPFAARIAGTKGTHEQYAEREYIAVDLALRVAAPLGFEFWGETVEKHREAALSFAARFRALAPITDKDTAIAGRDLARESQKVADFAVAGYAADFAVAGYAASAAQTTGEAVAGYATYAEEAAYTIYADAASSATYAASAADVRARSDALTRALWDAALACLDKMICVTESEG